MKKFLFCLLLVISSLFLTKISVKAQQDDVIDIDEFNKRLASAVVPNPRLRSTLIKDYRVAAFVYGSTKAYITKMSLDGVTVFCIEPNILAGVGTDYQPVDTWWQLSESTRRRIAEVLYYGYQSDGSDESFIATQVMIWEALGHWVTLQDVNRNPLNIDDKKAEIEARINDARNLPAFATTRQLGSLQYPLVLNDSNGVLSQFEVVCPAGIDCQVQNNQITVNLSDLGEYRLELIAKNQDSTVNSGLVYGNINDAQKVLKKIQPDKPLRNSFVDVGVALGKLNITKVDEAGEVIRQEGFRFVLSLDEDGQEAAYTFQTDENGMVPAFDLPIGTYYLFESETVDPYQRNEEVRQVVVTANQNESIYFVNKLKTTDLVVEKHDVASNELVNGALFTLYEADEEDNYQAMAYRASGELYLPETIPGESYEVALDEAFEEVIDSFEGNGEAYEKAVLPGSYYIRQNSDTLSVQQIEEGTAVFEELVYQRKYMVCEERAPLGYQNDRACAKIVYQSEEQQGGMLWQRTNPRIPIVSTSAFSAFGTHQMTAAGSLAALGCLLLYRKKRTR
ncbi:MAG: Cys-Gln thioester bond-forming surface protein [Erysipelotrichaceae bacterium]|jgi:hypothetical protein|nr:Cys-Gln thioester bond-forming surface protein [Erysipelotrichaceae bacterium]